MIRLGDRTALSSKSAVRPASSRWAYLNLCAALFAACAIGLPQLALPNQAALAQAAPASTAPRLVSAELIARFPHDPAAFTQGLIADGQTLFESIGQPGESQIRRVDLVSGRVLAARNIPADQFGEGLTRWRDELISLTWLHGIAHRWDARTLRPRGRSSYPGEGWGLTTLGDSLILSDGTDQLRVLDPRSFRERRRFSVTLNRRPLRQLNELEVVDGRIWANVWMTSTIVVIDPATGHVTHLIDLSAITREVAGAAVLDNNAVLNGIAFDPVTRRLFVTGKYWPTVFELRLPILT